MRFDRKKFFDGFRHQIDPTIEQEQVDGLEFLLARMEQDKFWIHIPQIAYALATVFHETAGSFQPVEEGYYLGSRSKVRNFQKSLRYYPYFGRGYVQLTWEKNYRKAEEAFGHNLVNKPDNALDPEVAYLVMTYGMHQGWFTGRKLDDYIKGEKKDYVEARRIINGKDKAGLIAGYARSFEKILNGSSSAAAPRQDPSDEQGVTTSSSANSATQPPPSTGTETSVTKETGNTTATVVAKNEQDVNETAKVPAPEPYNGIGFGATIKKDFAWLGIGNVGLQTFETWAQQASGWPEWLVQIIVKAAIVGAALSFGWLVFRAIHYAIDTHKKNQKAKTEALINSDITRKNIEWER